MSDICERLRREVAWEQDVGELLEEAAAEIAQRCAEVRDDERGNENASDQRLIRCIVWFCERSERS
jgi:hypothetical protein